MWICYNGDRMNYEKELFSLAGSVAELVRNGDSFRDAFGYAFRRSEFNPDLFHQVRIGVGSILRARREKHPGQLVLPNTHRSAPANTVR